MIGRSVTSHGDATSKVLSKARTLRRQSRSLLTPVALGGKASWSAPPGQGPRPCPSTSCQSSPGPSHPLLGGPGPPEATCVYHSLSQLPMPALNLPQNWWLQRTYLILQRRKSEVSFPVWQWRCVSSGSCSLLEGLGRICLLAFSSF